MSEDIDRRIAIEVLGEEKPPEPVGHEIHDIQMRWRDGFPAYSEGGNWSYRVACSKWDWWPVRFSSVLEEALRAADVALPDGEADFMAVYERDAKPGKRWHVVHYDFERYGHTLEVAICNLLLALKTEKA